MSKVYAREVIEALRRKKAMASIMSVPNNVTPRTAGVSPDLGMYVAKAQELVDYAVRNMATKPGDAMGALRDVQSFLRTLRSLVEKPIGR